MIIQNKKYIEEQKINYYQVDQHGRLAPAALLSALQNAALAHSDALGYTLDYLAERHCGWAVINWHIIIHRMPIHAETVRIETWCNKTRRMQSERGYVILDANGEKLVDTMSRWVFMDFAKRKIANAPADMLDAYGSTPPAAIENEKFHIPKAPDDIPVATQQFLLTRRDTDTNNHANNVKYLEWALDDIPDEIYNHMTIKEISIVYRKECLRGDTICTKTFVQAITQGTQTITIISDQEQNVLAQAVLLWEQTTVSCV